MKTFTKIFLLATLFTMLFSLPVLAREASISSPDTAVFAQKLNANIARVNAELDTFAKAQCGPNAEAIIAQQRAIAMADLAKVNKDCCQNHISYLTEKLELAKKAEKTRLDQLNWFKSLCQMSPTFAPKLKVAQAEYESAVAITAGIEANLAAAKSMFAPYL